MSVFKLPESGRWLTGVTAVGKKTKLLLRSVEPRRVLVLDHPDLDEVAAIGIIEAKPKAVINIAPVMTGKYPVQGALMLLKAGIPLLELSGMSLERIPDRAKVIVGAAHVHFPDSGLKPVAYKRFTKTQWKIRNEQAERNMNRRLEEFIDNTLEYAGREKHFVLHPLPECPLRTPIAGRHVVIVVRGSGYKNDLRAIRHYIEDYKPVLIGVDGGADALLEHGFKPDLIFGDMDSISDQALCCGAEIVVHAYEDGTAPGLERLRSLGMAAGTLPAGGTSEDVAMLLAYERKAELIVTLGAHSHMTDFLEKGRSGMASTVLVRMKIGGKLVDAKGVSKLYRRAGKLRDLWVMPAAAALPLLALAIIHPGMRHLANVVWTYLKLSVA